MAEPDTDIPTTAAPPVDAPASTLVAEPPVEPAERAHVDPAAAPVAAESALGAPTSAAFPASVGQIPHEPREDAGAPQLPRADAGVRSAAAFSPGPRGPLAAYEALALSARLPDLVAIAQKVLTDAASTRHRSGWSHVEEVGVLADEAQLARSDAETPFGNALKVLGAGPEGEAERSLACALWAHAIAEARRNDEDRLAGDVLWLAAHTPFDATPLLDRALGEEADELWTAVGQRIRRIHEGKGTSLGRAEAIVGASALGGSASPTARRISTDLARKLQDPTIARLLAGAVEPSPEREIRLEGEATNAPRSAFLTTVLALTGLLFVIHLVRFVARVALAYKRPAEVSLSEAGVRMKSRTEMLGRVLREREHVIVRAGLDRVVREVRYPRAAFYAGLLALAVGSYIGVRAFADGVRSASPSLLLTGLVVVIAGIAVDFVLGSMIPGTRGRVRISFFPRTGSAICLGDVDAARADDALKRALAK